MKGDSDLPRLRRLIDHHLPCLTVNGGEIAALTKDEEKNILVSLSKVLREVQEWRDELDSCSDDGDSLSAADSASVDKVSEVKLLLCAIVGDLIQLLTIDCQHVHHLLGHVLLAISGLLISSMKDWTSYIHVIFVCAELSIKSFLACSAATSGPLEKNRNCIVEECYPLLKPKLPKAHWSIVSELFRVVRCIWKYLKKNDSEKRAIVFLNYLSSFLSNIAWNSLNDIISHESIADKRSVWVRHFSSKIAVQRPELTFFGYFVQLLGSLVEKFPTELYCSSHDAKLLHSQVTNLIPQIFHLCLEKQGGGGNGCIPTYFRHKLLMLMIRVSSHQMDASILVLWLKLLHEYFEGFLKEPIYMFTFSQDESLEGSPFVVQIFDEESHFPLAHHLRRQAIFLFLRCSFSLIKQEKEKQDECECDAKISPRNLHNDCCSRRKGFLELQKWLQDNLPDNNYLDNQLKMEEGINFTSSLLHLYVNEDDLLFIVLLLLLSIPSQGVQRSNGLNRATSHSNEEILWHLSNIFDPIILFHLFLEQIHYDHDVLLDYLISRDIGVSCAEYLLRSLRHTCDSLQAFIEFPWRSEIKDSPKVKRRKFAIKCSESRREEPLSSVGNNGLLMRGREKCQDLRHKFHRTGEHFNKAKECLLSLQYAVQRLQQKNLFPYNPRVLLKRLVEFQELCSKPGSKNHDG
ncbi:hypothetical protein MLD38_007725 [Melastoma candidum]|uniref:Uncharacterized protein n=1 Tax=Melastoma candidum TaxID=119954 RepID=A0ACB9RRZ7_9MYRT|nr:hypothetical protein MLD38_007725 [Melastoma candidum]